MKTFTAILTTFAAIPLLTGLATAQPFNDRGDLFIDVAPPGGPEPREIIRVTPEQFQERNDLFAEVAPPGSVEPRPPVDAIPQAFQERSHYKFED